MTNGRFMQVIQMLYPQSLSGLDLSHYMQCTCARGTKSCAIPAVHERKRVMDAIKHVGKLEAHVVEFNVHKVTDISANARRSSCVQLHACALIAHEVALSSPDHVQQPGWPGPLPHHLIPIFIHPILGPARSQQVCLKGQHARQVI